MKKYYLCNEKPYIRIPFNTLDEAENFRSISQYKDTHRIETVTYEELPLGTDKETNHIKPNRR